MFKLLASFFLLLDVSLAINISVKVLQLDIYKLRNNFRTITITLLNVEE